MDSPRTSIVLFVRGIFTMKIRKATLAFGCSSLLMEAYDLVAVFAESVVTR